MNKEKEYHFEVIIKSDFIIEAENEKQAREIVKDTWDDNLYDEEITLLKVSEIKKI